MTWHLYFYQNMLCPHETPLLKSLSKRGGCEVTWVVDTEVLGYRREMGLVIPDCGRSRTVIAPSENQVLRLMDDSPKEALHIVPGPRGGRCGRTALAQGIRAGRRVLMKSEPGDPRGIKGVARRVLQSREAKSWGKRLDFVLAMGQLGVDWFVDRGYPAARLFPFTYCVESAQAQCNDADASTGPFRIIYTGALIERKRVDLLVRALADCGRRDWHLTVVGDGPLRRRIGLMAQRLGLAERIDWRGVLPHGSVAQALVSADLLVLPSDFDGWGAVVNEALAVGTPVVCSDACGAADLLRENWRGGVFRNGSAAELGELVRERIDAGRVPPQARLRIAAWSANSISGDALAEYLLRIIAHVYEGGPLPIAPWHEVR